MKFTEKLRLLLTFVFVGAIATFVILNRRSVTVSIIIGDVTMPLGFIVLFSALAGVGAALAFPFLKRRKPKAP